MSFDQLFFLEKNGLLFGATHRIHEYIIISHFEEECSSFVFYLQEEMGELADADERRFRALRIAKECQLLSAADVICSTCISAADSRLKRMRIK